MGSTSDEFYRFQSVQTTGGSCSCEAVKKPPFSGSSDQPCVDTGTFTRGLSTGGTVGGTGSGLYRLPVGHVPVKLSRNPSFSGSSDQPCVDTGTFTRGLSTGGTVGGTGSGLYRLLVGAVPVKLSRNPPSVVQ